MRSLRPLLPEYLGAEGDVCQVGPLLIVGFSPTGPAASASGRARRPLSGSAPQSNSSAAPHRNGTLPDRQRHLMICTIRHRRVGRMSHLTRRTFLKLSAGTLAAVSAASILDLAFLEEVPDISNPLESYPDRDWEKVYLDQYHYDRSFTFICAPNDTHNCRLRAFVRNG